MYRIHYYCPREAPFWQEYKEGLFFKTPAVFSDLQRAIQVCDSLVWRYHGARVIDPSGRVAYSI